MTDIPDLQTSSASELREALRSKAVSASELCEASIARIEALDGPINAVIVRDFDRARADAAKADKALASGDGGLLCGVPMTVKESFDLAGYSTTWGHKLDDPYIATEDAVIVKRLKAAGGVILGKTNVPPALADWQSDNPNYGRTNNPHDLTRSPGGSSGGSAAAIASGFSALEVGTDIGGSVRIPAAFCGVFGLKTTYGILSLAGHMPPHADRFMRASPLSVAGPIGRTAPDLALAMKVIAGRDAMTPGGPLSFDEPTQKRPGDFRVLVIADHPRAKADNSVRGALDDAAQQLEGDGATVARASDLVPDLEQMHRRYQKMLQTIINRRAGSASRSIPAHEYMDLEDAQHLFRRQMAAIFEQFDIVLMPTFGTGAFPHTTEPDWKKRAIDIDGGPTPYGDQMGWISTATFGNLPACAFPVGVDRNNMPISLQAIGPHLGDMTCLKFAELLARPVAPPSLG